MVRGNALKRGGFALLVAVALLLAGALGRFAPAAHAEQSDSLLRIEVSVRPEGLIEPGDVTLNFSIENVSEEDARNVYLSSADGLVFELVGQLKPGEAQTFSRQHSVTAQELEAGEVVYTVSCDDPADANVKINTTVRARIRRSDAQPEVEFTRQLSSRSVEVGGTLTIAYRVRNAGNVPLYDLQVQDSLGNYSGRIDALEVGESRALINRVPIEAAAVSSAKLNYRTGAGEEPRGMSLADVTVGVADASLTGTFAVGYSAFSKSTADVVLTLVNAGDVDYRDICVIDDLYGGVIADALTLPAGGEPLEISHAYAVRGDEGFRWRVTGVSDSGEAVDFQTETRTLPPVESGSPEALGLSVEALTPAIRREGDVTLRVRVDNPGGVQLRDLALSEESLGELYRFAILPADGAIAKDIAVHVAEDAVYNFSITGVDEDGAAVSASAAPVEVRISPDGALPEGARERLFEFTGGSIKIGGSSTFAVLLLVSFAVLLGLIVALIIMTRKARRERRSQIDAARRRRQEEMGKTNRFTPVRAAQETKKRGRNT